MKNHLSKDLFRLIVIASLLLLVSVTAGSKEVDAAAKITYTQKNLVVGQKVKLKIKGTKKKVKWSSSKEKVASISVNGKVKALESGKTVIKAKIGKKSYKCKISVWDPEQKEEFADAIKVGELVNQIREENGCKPLELNYDLCQVAMARAKELTKKFAHTRPDGSECFTIMDEYGFDDYRARGENIAYGFSKPDKVVNAWMHSEGHRDNILDKRFKELGVGIYYDEATQTYYWVQLFFKSK